MTSVRLVNSPGDAVLGALTAGRLLERVERLALRTNGLTEAGVDRVLDSERLACLADRGRAITAHP